MSIPREECTVSFDISFYDKNNNESWKNESFSTKSKFQKFAGPCSLALLYFNKIKDPDIRFNNLHKTLTIGEVDCSKTLITRVKGPITVDSAKQIIEEKVFTLPQQEVFKKMRND